MPGKPTNHELPRFQRLFGSPQPAILPDNRDALVVPSWPVLVGSWREVRSIGGNCDLAD